MPWNDGPSMKANGTIAPSRFVKIDTSGDHLVVQATAGSGSHGDLPIGICQVGQKNPPGVLGSDSAVAAAAGDPIQIWTLGDVAPLTCGSGGLTRGDQVKSDASGQGITASSTGDLVGAIAIESGAAAAVVLVQIVLFAHA